MSTTETNSLLEELKNLNSDLKGEFKNIKTNVVIPSACNLTTTISGNTQTVIVTPIIKPPLTNEGLSDFILAKTEELVMNGLGTVKDLQQTIGMTMDGKVMAAYANIIAATNTALTTLNAINLEHSKQKAQRELKEMELTAKKEIGPANNTHQTVNLIANRETILKMLTDGKDPDAIISKDYSVDAEN